MRVRRGLEKCLRMFDKFRTSCYLHPSANHSRCFRCIARSGWSCEHGYTSGRRWGLLTSSPSSTYACREGWTDISAAGGASPAPTQEDMDVFFNSLNLQSRTEFHVCASHVP